MSFAPPAPSDVEFKPPQPEDVESSFHPPGPGDLVDDSYGAQLKDLGISQEEADAAVAPAERTADLLAERKRAAKTGERADAWARFFGDAGSLLYGVAHPIESAGMVLNTAGKVTEAGARDVMAGQVAGVNAFPRLATVDAATTYPPEGPVREGLADAARSLPMVAAGAGLEAVGVPAPIAFGGTMGATAYAGSQGDESTRRTAGLKAAAAGSVLPAFGQMGKMAVAKGLGTAIEKGLLSGVPSTVAKAAEAIGSQGLIQVALEGSNIEEYWNMPPEQRRATIVRNLVANTAFMAMELPGVVGRGPSMTEQGLAPGARVGQSLQRLVSDPVAMDGLRQRVDDAVFDAMNGTAPKREGVKPGPVMELEQPANEIEQAPKGTINGAELEAREANVMRTGDREFSDLKSENPAKEPVEMAPLNEGGISNEAKATPDGIPRPADGAEIPKESEYPSQAEATVEQATLPRRVESDTKGTPADEPISLAEIRKYLSEALDIPVRMGVRVKGGIRGALGLFRPKWETIRMKALNDIPTLAHEVGHYLHYLLFPKSATAGTLALPPEASNFGRHFDGELLPLGRVTSKLSYTEAKVRREGVAEFFREWLTDRAGAMAKAPTFTGFFEGELQRRYPEVWKIATKAREDLGRYINQPAQTKIRSMISRTPEDRSVSIGARFRGLYDRWVNELQPLERALKQLERFGLPPTAARMVSDYAVNYIGGWRGKVEHSLFYRQIDLHGSDVGPSLRTILRGAESLDDFGDYLVAKRALEKNAQGKMTGIDSRDAHEVVRALGPKYLARAAQLREWQRNNLRLLLDSGLLNRAQFDAMEALNEDYVPFYRIYETPTGPRSGPGAGGGFVNLGQGVGRFKGSDRRIADPLESVVKNAYLFRDLAERNRVGNLFAEGVEAVRGGGRVAEEIARKVKPTTVTHEEIVKVLERAGIDVSGLTAAGTDLTFKVWRAARNQSAKDGIFTVWRAGKEAVYQLSDPDLHRALMLADAGDMKMFSKFFMFKVARQFTRTLRTGATLTLEFIARNPFRDQVTAGVFSKYGFIPFFDGFRGVLSALGKDHWYRDWMKAGGRYADFVAADRADLRRTLEEVVKEPGAKAFALQLADPRNVLLNLQKFSELMEQATRISEFRRAKRAGLSDTEAANASKDVTLNFSRAGQYGKLMNQLVAFFNASVQDVDKLIRAHQERPLQTGAKAFMYITLPSLLSWYLGKDDKEIQNLPEWRKNFFWNVNMGALAKRAGLDGAGYPVLSFPKPFLLGQIYGSSVERGLDYATKRDPNAGSKWLNATMQLMPINLNPENFIGSIAPTFARPVIEAWANKSFFKDQALESDALKRLMPSQRFTPNTSLTARMVSQVVPWDWNISPVKFDNTLRGYLGGLGKYGTDAADWLIVKSGLMNTGSPPEKSAWEWPMLRGFAKGPYEPSPFVDRFYRGADLAEQRVNTMKKAPELMEGKWQAKFLDQNVDDLKFYMEGDRPRINQLRSARTELGEIGKAMTLVQGNRTMDGAAKRARLTSLSKARDEAAEMLFKTLLSPGDQRRVY